MECEICGKKEKLLKTKIEGTILNVCKTCSKYGSGIQNISEKKYHKKIKYNSANEDSLEESIVSNYNIIVKNKREKLNLKQEDLAKQINEKISVIQHIENKKLEPSLKLSKKLERFLNIKLIEKFKSNYKINTEHNDEVLTLGDIIKYKKKTQS